MPDSMVGSRPHRIKKALDRFLPAVLVMLGLYLYLIFTEPQTILNSYTMWIQYTLLLYFVTELIVLSMLYENNREFLKNHWFDILLTIPFVTALKGLKGLKFVKSMKSSKLLKSVKLTRITKIGQKSVKLYKKGKKQLKRSL